MNKKFDLYITFPDGLEQSNAGLYKLIQSYIISFRSISERILSSGFSVIIKDVDFKKENFKANIEQSKTVMFFVHPSFEDNTDYDAELNEVCENFKIDNIDPLSGFSLIFKIYLEPLKKQLKNQCLEQLLSYEFFEKNIYNRKAKSFDPSTTGKTFGLYSRMLDLSYDFTNIIKNYRTEKSEDTESKNIFLGVAASDVQDSRDEIRRELQHYGYNVLPLINIPSNLADFENFLTQNLSKADAVVQIMGMQYGVVIKGSKYSLPDLQNKMIKEYMVNEPVRPLKRYIWIPSHNKTNDQRQTLFLNRLKRDEAGNNTEIIESPIETFKTLLAGRLSDNHFYVKEDYDNIFKVYLVSEENRSKEIEKIYSTLSLSGLKAVTLDNSEQIGIYARHLQKLRDCDSVIIFQQEDNKYWLNSKLRDLVKAPGIGRKKPFKKVVIVYKSTPDEHLLKMIRTNIELIENNKFDAELILQKLISE
jgi:hypothetical protein